MLTPGYFQPDYPGEPTGARDRLETFEYVSESLGNSRGIQLYLPARYDDALESYPLILVQDGPRWMEDGLLVNALGKTIGRRVRPVVVAFITILSEWWFESGGSRTEAYLEA